MQRHPVDRHDVAEPLGDFRDLDVRDVAGGRVRMRMDQLMDVVVSAVRPVIGMVWLGVASC